MAADIQQATGQAVEIETGDAGEFTVWVGDECVAEKRWMTFPTPDDIVSAVKRSLSVSAATSTQSERRKLL